MPEKYGTPGQWKSTLFYWVVPANVQGAWQVSAPDLLPASLPLALEQQYQFVKGAALEKGQRLALTGGRVDADRVSFQLALPGGRAEFRGVVEGERMRGEAVQGGRTIPWTAVRAAPAAAAN